MPPKNLQKCRFEEWIKEETLRGNVLKILDTFFTGRGCTTQTQLKTVATQLFPVVQDREFFEAHYELWQQRRLRKTESSVNLRGSAVSNRSSQVTHNKSNVSLLRRGIS